MKYYSTERPISPGSVPVDGLVEIHNFDFVRYVPEIDREAYGWAEYDRRLFSYEVNSYELVPEGMHIWWSVIKTVHKDGKVTASLGSVTEALERPQERFQDDGDRTISLEWLSSREAAERLADNLRT